MDHEQESSQGPDDHDEYRRTPGVEGGPLPLEWQEALVRVAAEDVGMVVDDESDDERDDELSDEP